MNATILGVVLSFVLLVTAAFAADQAFTAAQLTTFNGKNGAAAYFAYKGVVYDATGSQFWKEGEHYGLQAGVDLTGKMEGAPHGEEVLTRLPVVGSFASAQVTPTTAPAVTPQEKTTPQQDAPETRVWYENSIRPWGISLLGWTGILLGIFFVLNFATCFATPWGSFHLPWKGLKPGPDSGDASPVNMPWSHLHKYFVWLTIIFGIVHGILGFMKMAGLSL